MEGLVSYCTYNLIKVMTVCFSAYTNPLIKVYTSVILPPLDVAASFALPVVVYVYQPTSHRKKFWLGER